METIERRAGTPILDVMAQLHMTRVAVGCPDFPALAARIASRTEDGEIRFATRMRPKRADELIGPVFNERIADWGPHLQQMCLFWSSVALMSGVYHGQPMRKHQPLPVDGRHFDRWLQLFEATAKELCPPKAAEHFIERAHRIGESLELGIATAHGVMLAKGERLHRPELDAAE